MAPVSRIVTSPVRLTGRLSRAALAVLVAADTLVRRGAATGRPPSWWAPTVSGDLAVQLAVERELARSGTNRAEVGRDAFVALVREHEAAARAELAGLLAAFGIEADLEAGRTDGEAVARAARTAFVQLYEAGVVSRRREVVDTCPRCASVVDPADAEACEIAGEALTVELRPADGGEPVAVEVVAAELLPGAVAVAVPPGDPRVGATVVEPLTARPVPVVADPDAAAPWLVVPAHDPAAHALARTAGLGTPRALDPEGVSVEAPLAGLARFAARARAVDLLAAAGAVVGRREATEAAARCRHCGTVLLPVLGEHWFLAVADLEVAAADAVREGAVAFAPPGAREQFLAAAAGRRDACLSHQVWAGLPVPVARCADCGQVTVAVEMPESCGTCMGALIPDDDVLDAGFVAAVGVLAAAGWPADEAAPAREAAETVLLVGPAGVRRWAVPAAALGLRLAKAVPFGLVAVQEPAAPAEPADVAALLAAGPGAARLAVLAGDFDPAAAAELAASFAEPPGGDADLDALVEAFETAFEQASPAETLPLLAAAAREGIPPAAADRLRALAAPFLGGLP